MFPLVWWCKDCLLLSQFAYWLVQLYFFSFKVIKIKQKHLLSVLYLDFSARSNICCETCMYNFLKHVGNTSSLQSLPAGPTAQPPPPTPPTPKWPVLRVCGTTNAMNLSMISPSGIWMEDGYWITKSLLSKTAIVHPHTSLHREPSFLLPAFQSSYSSPPSLPPFLFLSHQASPCSSD